jgi:hypothetical protein
VGLVSVRVRLGFGLGGFRLGWKCWILEVNSLAHACARALAPRASSLARTGLEVSEFFALYFFVFLPSTSLSFCPLLLCFFVRAPAPDFKFQSLV